MARPRLDHLRADWKLSLPATIAAEVDLMLENPLTRKPKYGARSKLVEGLLKNWVATQKGEAEGVIPSLIELREAT